jgi:hypothetical protein
LSPIIPAVRRDAFDDPAWLFDLKLDGFRGLADTIAGRMISKTGNRLKRFEHLLDASARLRLRRRDRRAR